jgi:hypothetical protein
MSTCVDARVRIHVFLFLCARIDNKIEPNNVPLASFRHNTKSEEANKTPAQERVPRTNPLHSPLQAD